MNTTTRKFEATCRCGIRVTGNGVSLPWRHDHRPTDGHQASPVGVLYQI